MTHSVQNNVFDLNNTPEQSHDFDVHFSLLAHINDYVDKSIQGGQIQLNFRQVFIMIFNVMPELTQQHTASIKEICSLLNKLWAFFHHAPILKLSKYKHALEKLLSLPLINIPSDNKAIILQVIGLIERDLGNSKEAIARFNASIQILKSQDKDNLELLGAAYSRMGNMYRDIEDYLLAEKSLLTALTIETRINPQSLNLALTLNDYGKLLRDINQISEAIRAFKQAIKIYENISRFNVYEDYARCYGNLGTVYLKEADYKNAINCFKKCVTTQSSIVNTPTYHRALSLINLAKSYKGNKNTEKSVEHFNMARIFLAELLSTRHAEIPKQSRKSDQVCQKIEKKLKTVNTLLSTFNSTSHISTVSLSQGIRYSHHFDTKNMMQKIESIMTTPLESEFKEEYIFMLADFSLSMLAEEISSNLSPALFRKDSRKKDFCNKIKSHELSEFFNVVYKKNFNQFVNEFRIKIAKRFLLEKRHLSCLRIAGMVGFSSESGFLNAFKRLTKQTPGQFRRKELLKQATPA